MKLSHFILLTIYVCIVRNVSAQVIDFENTVPANWSTSIGTLAISDAHYKLGNESLRWHWIGGDTVTINGPTINSSHVLEFYHHTTELWIYNELFSDSSITFEFLDDANKVNYHFEFLLNFEGWRRISRSYKYDMYRIAGSTTNISTLRIVAPEEGEGKLYVDDWEYVKSRFSRIANRQMPDIQGYFSSSSHLDVDKYVEDIPHMTPTASELSDLTKIRNSLISYFKGGIPSPTSLSNATNYYNSLDIVVTEEGIKGNQTTPQKADSHLLIFARDFYHNGTPSSLAKAEEIIWLINDAGYAGGTDLVYGWYDTRNYFNGLLLIYSSLSSSLQNKIFDAIQWVFKMGEFWESTPTAGFDSDHIHTNLRYVLGALALCINDQAEAIRQLKGFKRYLERKNVPASSTKGWLKIDGTSFHHNTHYNAYMYSFSSYTTVLNFLDNTQFQLNQEAYKQFRDAAYAMLIYCNDTHFANSLSGRHPFSTNLPMASSTYNQLAYIGGTILGQLADPKIAGAYNRLWGDDNKLLSGYPTESFPEGFWQFNYSPIGVYRKNGWVATIHGMNKTFWGTEIYPNANRYGRYQSYGAVEIMYSGGRDLSGMNISGYDWNKPPGTTTKVLPWSALNPSGSRVDERAMSDYAAALRFEGNTNELNGKYGMYGFDFQQKQISSTHDESFKFKKSMFCFEHMIICLGSTIECTDPTNPIISTLFQSSLPNTSSPLIENGISQPSFPYNNTLSTGVNWLMDAWSTGYYVNTMDPIEVLKTTQSSPNQNGEDTSTTGDFASAWINHGVSPSNSSYEYVILPATTHENMNTFASEMQRTATQHYEVIQQNSTAHIVHHFSSNIYGYNFFDTNEGLTNTIIASNSAPCIIMMKEDQGLLILSLVDPATSFLQKKTIQVELTGDYSIQTADAGVSLTTAKSGTTMLLFMPTDGNPLDVTLSNNLTLAVDSREKPQYELKIYPNPTKNTITIIGDSLELKKLIVTNMLGKVVAPKNSIKVNDTTTILDLSNLPTGIYNIKTKTTSNKIYKQ